MQQWQYIKIFIDGMVNPQRLDIVEQNFSSLILHLFSQMQHKQFINI